MGTEISTDKRSSSTSGGWIGYRIVDYGISNDSNAVPNPFCDPGDMSEPLHATYQWAQEFDHHVLGSICSPTFAPFFAEAATLAADLCANGSQN